LRLVRPFMMEYVAKLICPNGTTSDLNSVWDILSGTRNTLQARIVILWRFWSRLPQAELVTTVAAPLL
jgi:hypothetical protein